MRTTVVALLLIGVLVVIGALMGPQEPKQDPKALEIVAKAVRDQGFVCDRPSYLRPVGMTERGEQFRLVCNEETLQYRMTMSPDRTRMSIRPWND